MDTKPLHYLSLRAILKHMDANLRIEISQRIPSIRKTERLVPLKIDRLRFTYQGVFINDTLYQLGIYQDYHLGDRPDFVRRHNPSGTLFSDIDHLGFQDFSTEFIEAPGDVVIHNRRASEGIRKQMNDQERDKKNVDRYVATYEASIERIEMKKDDYNILETTNTTRFEISELQRVIDCRRTVLLPYLHLRDNTIPTYTPWIQLTIKSKGNIIETERVKYNKKLYEAQKYLSNVLFEGRHPYIRVGHLQILLDLSVYIRFPVGLKMRIQKLSVASMEQLQHEKLRNLIDDSSYPLKFLSIKNNSEELDDPVIRTAGRLFLGGSRNPGDLNYPGIVMNLPNKIAEFERFHFTAQQHFRVVQHWLKSNREVGTEYMFNIQSKEVGLNFLKMVTDRIERAVGGDRLVTIPLKNNAVLRITYADLPAQHRHFPQASVKMEVLEVNHEVCDFPENIVS